MNKVIKPLLVASGVMASILTVISLAIANRSASATGKPFLEVAISDDEGQTWKWKRRLEYDPAGAEAGSYHYPSIIQSRDGTLHASYSYHLNRKDLEKDAEGRPRRKAIKHAHFNEEWVMTGEK